MPTVRINTYDQTTGPQGAALPQANIPGNFQIEANAARQFDILGNALRGLAGVEMRMKDAQRADTLNAARNNYLNDIMREQERLGNEDLDYGTQRERYVQFQKDRRDFYGAQLDGDMLQEFDNAILLPSTLHEFQVGQMAMAGLNDKILANVSQRISDLTSQSGFDLARDDEALGMIEQELATLVNNKVIGQDKAREVLEGVRNQMQLNQLGVMAQTDPQAIMGATRGYRVPVGELSKEGVVGKVSGNTGAIKNSIYDKAVTANQDPRMMMGIANAESSFNPSAKSGLDDKGRYAAGLFQFRGPAAEQVGLIDSSGDRRFDAQANIDGAMKYMDYIAGVVPGGRNRPDLMIAAWLMGPHNEEIQAGRVPADAVKYVNKVMDYGYGKDGMKGVGASGIAENAGVGAALDASGMAGGGSGQSFSAVVGGDYSKDMTPYNNLLAQGYTTQQVLRYVDLAEANIAAQQKLALEQAEIEKTNLVNSHYAQAWDEAKEKIPDMEIRHGYMKQWINSVPDRELRAKYQTLLDSDIKAEETKQAGINQQIISSVVSEVERKGMSKNQAWAYVQANPDMVKGIDRAGMQQLEKELVTERHVTVKNQQDADTIKYWIDKGRGQITRDQVQAACFQKDLTNAQVADVLDYYDGAGKMASATYSKINDEVKRQAEDEKGILDMPGAYEEILNLLPDGEKANADSITRAVNKFLMEGSFIRPGKWDKSMTYGKAVEEGVGASWLPDLTPEEEDYIQFTLSSDGVSNITEHKMRVYKREQIMGLPPYEAALEKDIFSKYPMRAR